MKYEIYTECVEDEDGFEICSTRERVDSPFLDDEEFDKEKNDAEPKTGVIIGWIIAILVGAFVIYFWCACIKACRQSEEEEEEEHERQVEKRNRRNRTYENDEDLDDYTEIKGTSWENLRHQAMKGNFKESHLYNYFDEKEKRLVDRLIQKQREQGNMDKLRRYRANPNPQFQAQFVVQPRPELELVQQNVPSVPQHAAAAGRNDHSEESALQNNRLAEQAQHQNRASAEQAQQNSQPQIRNQNEEDEVLTDDTKIKGTAWSALKTIAMQPNFKSQAVYTQLGDNERRTIDKLIEAQRAQGNMEPLPWFKIDPSQVQRNQNQINQNGWNYINAPVANSPPANVTVGMPVMMSQMQIDRMNEDQYGGVQIAEAVVVDPQDQNRQ